VSYQGKETRKNALTTSELTVKPRAWGGKMKRIAAIVLSVFFTTHLYSGNELPRILSLKDGSVLHGEILSAGMKDGITWKYGKEAGAQAVFPVGMVNEIMINKLSSAGLDTGSVFLANGDELKGEVVALDNETLSFKTPYAGVIKIPAASIEAIFPSRYWDEAYKGPDASSKWSRVGKAVVKDKNSMVLSNNARTGCFVILPEMIRIDFTVDGEASLVWEMCLQIGEDRKRGNYLVMKIDKDKLSLFRRNESKQEEKISEISSKALDEAGDRKFSVTADRIRMIYKIKLNGEELLSLSDPKEEFFKKRDEKEAATTTGTASEPFYFKNSSELSIKIKEVVVSRDGTEAIRKKFAEEKYSRSDVIISEKVFSECRITGVAEGKLSYQTRSQMLETPLKNVGALKLGNRKGAAAVGQSVNLVRIFFAADEHITILLDRVADGKVLGRMACGADISIPLEQVGKLVFSPDLELKEPSETANRLHFDNGDVLYGNLVAVVPGTSLSWKLETGIPPLKFPVSSAKEAIFRGKALKQEKDQAKIRLVNGNIVRGEIKGLDNQKLSLKTSYAENLGISRLALDKILFSDSANEWNSDYAKWIVEANAEMKNDRILVPAGDKPQARCEIQDSPEKLRIEFDIIFTEQMKFMVFSKSKDFLNYDIYLCAGREKDPLNVGQGVMYGSATRHRYKEAHVKLLLDKENKFISLNLNSETILATRNNLWFAHIEKAKNILLMVKGASAQIKNFTVSREDGSVLDVSDEDVISLKNEDKIAGKVQDISGKNVKFDAKDAGQLDIPAERIYVLNFSDKAAKKKTVAGKNSVTVCFNGYEETATFDLSEYSVEKQLVSGGGGIFEKISIPMGIVDKIVFGSDEEQRQ